MTKRKRLINSALAAAAAAMLLGDRAAAVPSFAAQTGQPCQSCHVGGFGPQLTQYGREFKIGGYTTRAVPWNVPLSAQAIGSFTATRKAQAAPPTPDFHTNNNLALDQIGIFLGGGIGNHFGGLAQATYSGTSHKWSWDNTDLRAVDRVTIVGTPVVIGASLNNNPGIDDPWNTLPGWGYPYSGSALLPSPATAPLFSGGLGQKVVGLTAYAWIDGKGYVEGGGFRTPSVGTLRWLGSDPYSPGDINGIAPYGRIAYQQPLGAGDIEVGAFALRASLFPSRDRTTGNTDRYTDTGIDASFQLPRANSDVFSINARYTHEDQRLGASQALGNVGNSGGNLDDFRIDGSYYFRQALGGTVQFFQTTGSSDFVHYGGRTGRPDSDGFVFQIDGTPFGNDSPVGSWFNVRLGVQYTAYTRFDGARINYDGSGTNAADNNSLRIFAWLAL
ncbi:hypothetical protein [Polymorphobacter megasporae]|uniref:hypothetical protein n=1 Tax=Glacieibacterium megasporae TaxID=2835787 RepID=UPI001C1DFF26|nr:hypothetical protein [Polymorphobacter megasporae]UAJ12773.1 hypothetical protein KTC28_19720 [Polymorphobacter megasporae]